MMHEERCLQERWAPGNRCFGCGPANDKGLRIRSFADPIGKPGELIAHWTPQKHHEAFEGILNGGIIGALLDCHSNWAAVWHLMQRDQLDHAPCCVTAEFKVGMRAPTPSSGPLIVRAWPVSSEGNWVTVEATLGAASGEAREAGSEAEGDEAPVSATCSGKFVKVKPGHPAYHRW